jgi:hypothetical protein
MPFPLHTSELNSSSSTATPALYFTFFFLLSFLGSTAQLRPWPPQNPAEFLGGFSTISFFTG